MTREAVPKRNAPRKNAQPNNTVEVLFEGDLVHLVQGERTKISLTTKQALQIATMLSEEISEDINDNEVPVIFFTDEIDSGSVESCQKQLLRFAYIELDKPKEERNFITMFINSPGGSCDDGMALIDTIEYIRGMGVQIVGIAIGAAYSMAAVILQACSKRLVARHARIMLHEVSSGYEGKLSELRQYAQEVEETNRRGAEIFASHNTKGHNTTEFWIDFIDGEDKYLSPEECLGLGLVDEIYQPLKKWQINIP